MKQRIQPGMALITIVLACVALVGVLVLRARSAEVAMIRAQDELAGEKNAVVRLHVSAGAAETECAHIKMAVASAKTRIATSKAAKKPAHHGANMSELLQKNPEAQLAFLRSQRAQAMAQYGALFQKLHLSADQTRTFEGILAHRAEENMDVNAAIGEQGLSPGDSAVQKLWADTDTEFKEAEKTLLGPDGYAEAQQYERAAVARRMVDNYAGGAVTVAGEPLTEDQGEQLVQIIAGASPDYRQGGTVNAESIDWPAVVARAGSILSPAQLALITSMEPPLPSGARYQTQLYRWVDRAQETEPKNPALTAANGK